MREDNRGRIARIVVIVALLGLLVVGYSAMKGCFGTEVIPEAVTDAAVDGESREEDTGHEGEESPQVEEEPPEGEVPQVEEDPQGEGDPPGEGGQPGEPGTPAEDGLREAAEEAAEMPGAAVAGIAEAVTEFAGPESTEEKKPGAEQEPKNQETEKKEKQESEKPAKIQEVEKPVKLQEAEKPENSPQIPVKKTLTGKVTENNGVLKNTIRYSGLKKGEEYVITGTLMDQETGEEILVDGQPIKASRFFTAIEDKGSVKMKFPVSTEELKGKRAVAFQKVYDSDGNVVLEINDLDAEGQSVAVPGDKMTGSIKAEELHRRNQTGDRNGYASEASLRGAESDLDSGSKGGSKSIVKKVLFLILMASGVLLLAGTLKPASDVKQEGDDVSVLNHIFLAFRT